MHLDQWSADPGPQRFSMSVSPHLIPIYRHLGLWVLQGWLAMFFIGAAIAKLGQPHDLLVHLMQWPAHFDLQSVRLLGVLELALAVGLTTPLLSWRLFRPLMLTCSAVVLIETLVMGGYHLVMGHFGLAAVNALLAGFAGVVLYGRRAAARTEGGPA